MGSVASLFAVDELLEQVFSEKVSGIDAIVTTSSHSMSYTIKNGVVEFLGEDYHSDGMHLDQQQSMELIDEDLYWDAGSFRLTLIPNHDLYTLYHTNNPILACMAVILSIIVASVVFMLYDYLVRREFQAKKDLLDARRQFMVRSAG